MAECVSPQNAIIQWDCDSSFSVIPSSSIQSGREPVGENVEAYYGRKLYSGTIVELGSNKDLQKNVKLWAHQNRQLTKSKGKGKTSKRQPEECLVTKEKRKRTDEAKKQKEKMQFAKHSMEKEIANAIRTVDEIEYAPEDFSNGTMENENLYYPDNSTPATIHNVPPRSVLQGANGHMPAGVLDQQYRNARLPTASRPSPRNSIQFDSARNIYFDMAIQDGSLQTPSNYDLSSSSVLPQNIVLELSKKIDFALTRMEELTERIQKLEGNAPQSSDNHHLGGLLTLTKGQYHTIKCVSQTQKWTCTLRKLMVMLYSDDYLQSRCAIGKKSSQNTAMDKDELGVIKGFIMELYPENQIGNGEFNAIVNSICCMARRRKNKTFEQ